MVMPGTTLAAWSGAHAARRPDEEAVASRRARLDWGEFDRAIRRVAAGLAERGVGTGDRVGVVSDNRIEMLIAFGAASHVGAIFAPIHPKFGPRELEAALEVADPALVVADPSAAERLRDGETLDRPASLAVLPDRFDPEVGGLGAPPTGDAAAEVAPSDVGLLAFTSGTTGRPKGVPHTWRNMLWNHRQFIDGLGLTPADRNYAAAPLAHIAGLGTMTGPLLYLGGTTILEDQFEGSALPERIEEFDATCTFMVPAMWRAALEGGEWEGRAETLRFGLVGGAPVRASLVERANDCGVDLHQGYGMTEAGPMVSLLRSDDPERHARLVGRPGMHVDCRVVDEGGEVVSPGTTGELHVRGPNVVDGYWSAPDRSERAFVDGWFRTGDIVRRSPDGGLELLGRTDDLLITGGENIYPGEIESVLSGRDDVEAVAVVGRDDPTWGEVATAVVVPTADGTAPTLEELVATARSRLADFKAPRRLAVADELPRTATGKVDRDEILSRFERGALEIRESADD